MADQIVGEEVRPVLKVIVAASAYYAHAKRKSENVREVLFCLYLLESNPLMIFCLLKKRGEMHATWRSNITAPSLDTSTVYELGTRRNSLINFDPSPVF